MFVDSGGSLPPFWIRVCVENLTCSILWVCDEINTWILRINVFSGAAEPTSKCLY